MTEGYDPYTAWVRIETAANELNWEAVEVVTLHLALERELEFVLSKKCLRSTRIARLSFVAKSAVLHSLGDYNDEDADKLYNVLWRFNELRNAVAHGNSANIKACRENLQNAYLAINPTATSPFGNTVIAQGICAYMGKGMMPDEFSKVAALMDEVVREKLPLALGRREK